MTRTAMTIRCSVESTALDMNRCVTPVGKLEFLTQAASVIAEVVICIEGRAM